jgi:5'-methylthioadenosine nucleosidase
MEQEAKPFVEHLGLSQVEGFFPGHTPFLAFEGKSGDCQVTVITFGKDQIYGTGVDNVGTVSSSLATYLALSKIDIKFDLVINAGTCGGFQRKGLGIGDVVLTTGVANHDRRIPIPGFDAFGIGQITTLDPSKMAEALGFKTGVCTTGNSLDKVEKDDELMLANDASVKDMEAGAIAWVCKMCSVPYLGVKVITDVVDGGVPAQEEFLANLSTAAQSLQASLPKVIAFVADKNVEDL